MQILQENVNFCLLVMLAVAVTNGQRVAPGVNPQHYQQPPVQHPQHQQYQQPPQPHLPPGVAPQQYQQYQQVPVQQQAQQPIQQQQYQQVPQQQQQVPQQQQQQPVHQVPQQQQQQGHAPHGHGHPQQVLNAANIEHERAHIQEHIQVPIDTSKMSEAELQFHYFKMHDSDNNNKLDGCELIKSLIHWHAHEDTDAAKNQTETETNSGKEAGTGKKDGTIYTDKSLGEIIDYVLKTMDLNDDGYVDYTEYRQSEKELDKH